MASVIPWTEIVSFQNIRKYTQAHPEILNGNPVVTYKAKVKLHGNNGGIQFPKDGELVAQSRTSILVPGKDPDGFGRWVDSEKEYLSALPRAKGLILFGEWCGPGIQSSVAISGIENKIFAVFAARPLDTEDDTLIVYQDELDTILQGVPIEIYTLPWHKTIEIDWSASDEELQKKVDQINEWVLEVEKNDPWVEETFHVKGTGEGLVFYPVSNDHIGYKNYCNLVFKAKGEKHRVLKTKEAAQVNVQTAESINAFADMVLTEARLEQGAKAIHALALTSLPNFDNSLIGKFVDWIRTDVMKETKSEMDASGLDWKQVQKPISDRARNWYLGKIKSQSK